jgi:hypothetical protein
MGTMKSLQTALSVLATPVVLPVILAAAVVDTLVFGDKTSIANDIDAGVSDAIDRLAGRPQYEPEFFQDKPINRRRYEPHKQCKACLGAAFFPHNNPGWWEVGGEVNCGCKPKPAAELAGCVK